MKLLTQRLLAVVMLIPLLFACLLWRIPNAPAATLEQVYLSPEVIQRLAREMEFENAAVVLCDENGASGFELAWSQYIVPLTLGYLRQRGCGRFVDTIERHARRKAFDLLDSSLRTLALTMADQRGAGEFAVAGPDFATRYAAALPSASPVVRVVPITREAAQRVRDNLRRQLLEVRVDNANLDNTADEEEDANLDQLTSELAGKERFDRVFESFKTAARQ